MARTPRNRTKVDITNENNVNAYLDAFSSMSITAAGGYSKNINNEGWVTQSGATEISNQGLIKTISWAVAIVAQRASGDDAEARTIMENICPIVTSASRYTLSSIPVSSVSVEAKPEGNGVKVENINNHVHTHQPNN